MIPGMAFLNTRENDAPRSYVPFATAVKKVHSDIAVGAVGLITTVKQANSVLVAWRKSRHRFADA